MSWSKAHLLVVLHISTDVCENITRVPKMFLLASTQLLSQLLADAIIFIEEETRTMGELWEFQIKTTDCNFTSLTKTDLRYIITACSIVQHEFLEFEKSFHVRTVVLQW
jgi:hypothetical protein